MSRLYSAFTTSSVTRLLDKLADKNTAAGDYRSAMYDLGVEHGKNLAGRLEGKAVGIACTVEDADFLAKGILSILEKVAGSVSVACFWNKRISGHEAFGDTAPILRKYKEPSIRSVDTLIVVKSIISGSCVVKTNLTHLIRESEPSEIVVVAPVMYSDARSNLEKEFPLDISNRFTYSVFAIDDVKNNDGEVVPGIGGNVYSRLGFGDQDGKNRYTPSLVASRRGRPTVV